MRIQIIEKSFQIVREPIKNQIQIIEKSFQIEVKVYRERIESKSYQIKSKQIKYHFKLI